MEEEIVLWLLLRQLQAPKRITVFARLVTAGALNVIEPFASSNTRAVVMSWPALLESHPNS